MKKKMSEFPKIDLSSFELSNLPKVDFAPVREALRDAAYMTIGLGVVAVEEVSERRRIVAEKLNARLAAEKERGESVRARWETRFTDLDKRIDELEARIETAVDKLEAKLPEQAAHLVGQARNVGRVARQQVRDRIRPAA